MAERVLKILRRQVKNIYCILDGKLLESVSSSIIESFINQIEEIGSIRKNTIIFDNQLKSETFDMFIKHGISPIIVPSDRDINIALECLNVINTYQVDILCIGVLDDSLLPVVIKARETTDILLVCQSKESVENFMPFVDFLIAIDDLS
ncbi:MAG: hypothetical protein ACXABK_06795 [Candidatus Heimdallarchaeaceae archaeon]|jgi:uncharacterized protein (TIGR00288 family)